MSDNFFQSFLIRFRLYPRDNKEQGVRIRRFFMAAGTYAVAFVLGFIQSWLGIMEARPLFFLLIVVGAFLVIYYILSYRVEPSFPRSQPDRTPDVYGDLGFDVWRQQPSLT